MEGFTNPTPRTVEEVFSDFRDRRAGLIKPLTIDMEKLYRTCDPEKENLCLFGLPNETWEVSLPDEEVPPELPEPALGINFARDGMQKEDWVSLVAGYSDSWLLSVAFYFGAHFGFVRNERKRLFQMINDLPTIFEVVTGNTSESDSDSEDDSEQGGPCGRCGDNFSTDEFWIFCDECKKWFHGRCVKITPEKAEHILHYRCPRCSYKRATRPC